MEQTKHFFGNTQDMSCEVSHIALCGLVSVREVIPGWQLVELNSGTLQMVLNLILNNVCMYVCIYIHTHTHLVCIYIYIYIFPRS